MKRLRVVLGLACVGLLLCAGFLGAILAVLRPERAPAEIARPRPARERVVRDAPVETGCALHVRVRDPAGAPVTAEVTILPALGRGTAATTWTVAGARELPIPCGHAVVDAEARGYARGVYAVEVVEGEVGTLVVELDPGERVYGTVLDEGGEPVPDAIVRGGGRRVPTDADGSYELWMTADESALYAEAFGHDDAHALIPREDGVAAPAEGWRVDFTLVANAEIRVWCAGLPDDACGEMPLQCTVPWSPVGNRCRFDDETGETRCPCPEGTDEVAVRGGGRAVLVEAGAREAWLDFRDAGAIVGRVLLDGAPPYSCEVVAIRVPEALEDLPRGLVAGRFARCEEDGRFRIDGVVEGDWEVAAQASSEAYAGRHERILVPRRVGRGAVVDVGDIRLPGGGVVEGVVIDGVTGERLSDAAVIALREGGAHERVTAMGDETEHDGSFRIEGLPAGTWTVAPMLAPQESVTVTVREDAVTGGVRLVTSQATALAENGFELQDEDGALVVSDVTEGSPADLAGLVPGDEVTGVLVAGFDVTSGMGSRGGDIARAILGHWDGPGVTLVVRGADGGEEEVPLEW